MKEFEQTKDLNVSCVVLYDCGDGTDQSYRVGFAGITKIEQFEKSGMYANIPYLRVYKDDQILSEHCQHNILSVIFDPF